MFIPFVWLYVFKCYVYTQLLVDQTQQNFWVFYMFLKVFLCFCVFRVFAQNVYFLFLSKNSFRGIFASMSRVTSSRENDDGKFRKHWNSYREFHNCLTSKFYPRNYYVLQWPFSRVTLREAYQRKTRFCSF